MTPTGLSYSQGDQKISHRARLNQNINNMLLRDAILSADGDLASYVQMKKDQIIAYHVEHVYPIIKEGDYHYTKLTPKVRGHEGKKCAKNIEDLYTKIIAHYLGIEDSKTVRQVLDDALVGCTPQNATRHRQILKQRFSIIADKKVSDLTEDDIRDCLSDMIKLGISSQGYTNAKSTLHKIYDQCRYDHIECIDIREKIKEFDRVKLTGKQPYTYKLKKPHDYAFREKEAIKLYKYCIEHPDVHNLAVALLLTTGLRIGEIAALEINDIDMEEHTASITKRLVNFEKKVKDNAKDNSDRIICLNSDAMTAMQLLVDLPRDGDKLAINPYSSHEINSNNINERLQKLHDKLGFTGRVKTAHDCRRTYASLQYIHDPDSLLYISHQLGHSSIQQTIEYIKDIVEMDTRKKKLDQGSFLLSDCN